jgi:hypothetical protein
MSQIKVNAVTDGSGGNTATINSMTPTADSLQGFRNRIINGDMRIDQRNAGAVVTTTSTFPVDRFYIVMSAAGKFTAQQNAGSVTPPAGFTNYLGATSTSAYTVGVSEIFNISQRIEGFNTADFAWGTASAKTVTLSFWVRSSLTGTFGGAIYNSGSTRNYPFTYTINSANTWEYKTVTIPGDTSGTWVTNNGYGLGLSFGLGVGSTYSGTAGAWSGTQYFSATGATSVVGTNGATFYITGVQLEVGSVATSFERRPYGTELALCQRYYYKITSTTNQLGVGWNQNTTVSSVMTTFPVTMRTAPSALEQTGTAANYRILHTTTATTCSAVPLFGRGADHSAITEFTVASGLTAGQGSAGAAASGVTAYLAWSVEL